MNSIRIVLAGPSGAGKDSVIREILNKRNNILLNVSYTSRKKRQEETNGLDYNFVTRQEFEEMIAKDEFIEYVDYDGEYYGTRKLSNEELESNDIIFRKDVRGAISIKDKYPFVITFYIMPTDSNRLKMQKGKRGENRDKIAKDEKDPAKELDFLIINDKIEKAADEIISIIEIYRAYSMRNPDNISFMDNFYK